MSWSARADLGCRPVVVWLPTVAARRRMQWTPLFSALSIVGDRWASRCPACPSLSCPAISVALTCGGPASTGAISTDGSGFIPLIAVASLSAFAGAFLVAGAVIVRLRVWPLAGLVAADTPSAEPDSTADQLQPLHASSTLLAVADPQRPSAALTPSAKRAAAANHGGPAYA